MFAYPARHARRAPFRAAQRATERSTRPSHRYRRALPPRTAVPPAVRPEERPPGGRCARGCPQGPRGSFRKHGAIDSNSPAANVFDDRRGLQGVRLARICAYFSAGSAFCQHLRIN